MRALIVAGGCRGLDLARELVAGGDAVRITTRDERGRAAIEQAGAECWIGTPDVIGTLRYALESVTLLLWLLGTAEAAPEQLEALHGSRLRMMLEKTTDTTVRGVLYEAAGTVPAETLALGVEEMRRAQRTNEIPFRLLHADPRGPRGAWLDEARAGAGELLAGPRRVSV